MCVGLLAGMVPAPAFAEGELPDAAVVEQETPAPTETPMATVSPAPSESPATADTPAAEETPVPTATPAIEETAAPTETPLATETPTQTPTAEVTPASTETPCRKRGKPAKGEDKSAADEDKPADSADRSAEDENLLSDEAQPDETAAPAVKIIPRKADGTAVLKVNETAEYPLSQVLQADEWNALALVYAENETECTVAVYINGEQVLPATAVGFKLSEKSGIVAAFGATVGTGFMRTGLYDGLVVTDTADAYAAKAETAARKQAFAAAVQVDGVVDVTGAEVETAAQNVNGWTYKGLGMLNGNSTSNLLLDYKAENPAAYNAMMQYLFGGEYPLFSNIKMEMGNDGNNSTGAEACTMRYEDEEADASRSPGFVMATDAKKSTLPSRYPSCAGSTPTGSKTSPTPPNDMLPFINGTRKLSLTPTKNTATLSIT